MTANQVAYWQMQEAKRHNAVTERQQGEIQAAQRERMAAQTRIDQYNAKTQRRIGNSQTARNYVGIGTDVINTGAKVASLFI